MVRSMLVPSSLEVVDQLLGTRIVVVDDLTELAAILRIHLVEQLLQQYGVLVIASEDDGLAGQLTGRIADPVFHQVAKDGAVGILVVDDLVDLLGREVVLCWVLALFLQLLDLLLGQRVEIDALTQELRCVLEDLERSEITLLDSLLQIVVGRGLLTFAIEQPERVARDEIDRRCGQADLVAVEVVKHIAIDVVDTAMRSRRR